MCLAEVAYGSLVVHRNTNVKDAEERATVSFKLNGSEANLDAPEYWTLADALREKAGLTGLHLGCEHGVCGACTVLLDGEPVRSCIVLAAQAEGHEVATIEALASDGGRELHPIQQAFTDHHALQCGYCTPGFIMLIAGILGLEPDATPERLRHLLSSNLCRCTGYQSIVTAALSAQQEMNRR